MLCTVLEQDVEQKIHGCFFRWKGEAVYVIKSNKRGKLNLYRPSEVANGKIFREIDLRDPDFDISSVPLGYMNYDPERVGYFKRIPVRRVRQGVCETNVRLESIDGGRNDMLSINRGLNSKGFEEMVAGTYPPVYDAIKKLRKEIKTALGKKLSRALTRDIAATINKLGILHIYFKQELVGHVPPDSDVVQVRDDAMGWVVTNYLSAVFGHQKVV